MARAALIALLVGCAGEPEAGMYVSYEVHSLREFDRVHVVLTGGVLRDPRAPLTPTMVENDLPPPNIFEVRGMRHWQDATMAPTRRFHYEYGPGQQLMPGMAVLAFRGDELVGAGAIRIEPIPQDGQRWLAEGVMNIDPAPVELWGIAAGHGGAAAPCFRIDDAVTQYVVREIDSDCDLTFDADDCFPFEYCGAADPFAPECCSPHH